MVLVGDLVQHVIEFVHRVDDLPHIRLLKLCNLSNAARMDFQPAAIAVQIAINTVDVVIRMIGMLLPGIGREL